MKKLLIILFLLPCLATAGNLKDLKIDPLNRSVFFFSKIDPYQTELSDDKQKITITFENSKAGPDLRELGGTGIIQDIIISESGNNIIANIILDGPRGFSAYDLPYTNSISIEVFKWDNLSPEEDLYRQALFAWQDSLWDLADSLLKESSKSEVADAQAMLGLLQMKNGNASDAILNLLNAEKNGTKIYDTFAALSQIYALKGLQIKQKEYSKKFTEMTGLKTFPELPVFDDPDDINVPEPSDTSTNEKVTASKDSSYIVAEIDNPIAYDPIAEIIKFTQDYIYVILGAFGFMMLGLYYAYNNWRKHQIQEIKKMSDLRFNTEVEAAKERAERKARVLKETREEVQKTKKDNSQNSNDNLLSKTYGSAPSPKIEDKEEKIELKQKKVKPIENVKTADNKNELVKFLENYIPIKRQEEEENIKNAMEEAEDLASTPIDDNVTRSPGVDLAMKMAEQMHKNKQDQILNLARQTIEDKEKGIDEKAKELGLEKESLSTKNNLDDLSLDNEKLSKLSQKFAVDKEDDEEKNEEN